VGFHERGNGLVLVAPKRVGNGRSFVVKHCGGLVAQTPRRTSPDPVEHLALGREHTQAFGETVPGFLELLDLDGHAFGFAWKPTAIHID
jgi:hypothetical protein